MANVNRYCSTCNSINRNDMYYGKKRISNVKNLYTQAQVVNQDNVERNRFQEYESQVVYELLSQVTVLKGEKVKLESDKELLKTEYECLKMKHENYIQISNREKTELKESIEKLKRDVKHEQLEKVHLTNSYLEEQRKYLEQIGELRNSLLGTLDDKDGNIDRLTKEKSVVENKLKDSLTEIDNIKKTADAFKRKSNSYKQKFKLATEYIKQIMHEIEENDVGKQDKESQTKFDVVYKNEETQKPPPSVPINGCVNLDETENSLLSELFFNIVPTVDNIDPLFENQTYQPVYSPRTINF